MLPMNKEEDVYPHVKNGTFAIDNAGRVWRTKTNTRAENKTGLYLQVRVMSNGIRHHALAHRLVWMHFNGQIPNGLTINHKNGKTMDNRPENLELATYSEQAIHSRRVLKHGNQNGQKNPNAKLTDHQVMQIRGRYAAGGITQKLLADEMGVSYKTISKIVRGDRRRNQGGQTADYTSRRRHGNWNRDETGRFAQ